jgi:hypothetical protein
MIEYLKAVLLGQYEAALAMLNECIAECPDGHWDGVIAASTMRQIAYHTLFFADLYLTAREEEFELRELHGHGGDERGPELSPGLGRGETLEYVRVCRRKVHESLAAETAETLQGASGHQRRNFSRGELHIYNIRHIQHHAGAMAAYLRRVDPALRDWEKLRWVGSGWR